MWALDLGTTNTALARWRPAEARPELLELPSICRKPGGRELLDAPRMVPSAAELLDESWTARMGRWSAIRHLVRPGTEALIGRPAIERNTAWPSPAFAPGFKSALGSQPTLPLVRVGTEHLSAREVARRYLRELFAHSRQQGADRIRDLVITVPVGSFDTYRAELRGITDWLGVEKLRFLDEPVAAAIGYGVSLDRPRQVLVFDMGGGTWHLARVQIHPRGVEAGRSEVQSKQGGDIGGDRVDSWLVEELCAEMGLPAPQPGPDETERLWERLVRAEARKVKEALHFEAEADFTLVAPEELRGLRSRLQRGPSSLRLGRDRLTGLLERRGLMPTLRQALDALVDPDSIEEVLLVGGSTLLPGLYPLFESRFGRDRVRAWQPFESVVLGAASYAGQGFVSSDLIVHDYAIEVWDSHGQKAEYAVVIPRGTRFPTPPDLWQQQLVPTCALAEPERIFKLIIYEIGARTGGFAWDGAGQLHSPSSEREALRVPLNANSPALGHLDPPHPPEDRRPRLQVGFGVNAERWLVATVRDLKTGRLLKDAEPVVRLL